MTAFNAGLPKRDEGATSYIGQVALIPQPSSGVYAPPDGTKWLASGAVIPASQSPTLINTDLRCVKANLDINLPVTLTAAARFALTSSVTWIIDAAGAVLYSTDGSTWNNTAPSGGGAITFFIGYRNTGSGIEVFAGSSTQLFRAVITDAAPQTVAWSVVATISSTTYFSGASYAFDGVNHLICWAHSTAGSVAALTSTNGTAWAENAQAAASAENQYKCVVVAKPGGGFRVLLNGAGAASANCYSTTSGATFTKLNSSGVGGYYLNGDRLGVYVGSRLFYFSALNAINSNNDSLYSDDHGVTWNNLQSLHAASQLGVSGTGGASWDGATLSFVGYSTAAGAYLIYTADGVNFKSTQLFMSSSEIASIKIGQVIAQRFVFIPTVSTKNKLLNIQNAFKSNASTDFVGLANRNAPYVASAPNNFVYGVRVQ